MEDRTLEAITSLPASLFERPRRLVRPDWAGHLPFLALVLGAARPRLYVELGVFHGDSYCYACQISASLGLGTRCVGIDSWEGDIHTGSYGERVYEELKAHHDPLYGGFSRLERGLFEERVDRFENGSIDLLHLDGEHTYEAVSRDFRTWLPKVAPGGIVLLHDTDVLGREEFGVWKLWEELIRERPGFRFPHCNGLGVLLNGPVDAAPAPLRGIFDCTEDARATFRAFFEAVGTRYVFEAHLGPVRASLGPADSTSAPTGLEALTATLEECARVRRLLARSRLRKLRYVLSGRI